MIQKQKNFLENLHEQTLIDVMAIIALGYKKHSGKDTVGLYLRSHYGFYRVGFADHLKRIAQTTFRLPSSAFEGENKEALSTFWYGMSHRRLLQYLGDAMKKQFGQDFFIKAANIPDLENTFGNVVITDLRTKEEFTQIKEWGGICIKIDRQTGFVDNHSTECALDGHEFDYVIENNGTLEELYYKIDHIMIVQLGFTPKDLE